MSEDPGEGAQGMDAAADGQTIADMIASYQAGMHTRWELHAEIFRRLRLRNVDSVMAALPPDIAGPFIEWARENYDNTIPPSEFIAIGGEGVLETPDEAFDAIRAWFAARRGT